MNTEIIVFNDDETERQKFHCYKNLIFLEDVNINSILISHKVSSGETKLRILYWLQR